MRLTTTSVPGFSPALRSGFQGASLNTQAAVTSKAFGPTMKAEAWVRVCTSDSIVGNNQQDALIAGARESPHAHPLLTIGLFRRHPLGMGR